MRQILSSLTLVQMVTMQGRQQIDSIPQDKIPFGSWLLAASHGNFQKEDKENDVPKIKNKASELFSLFIEIFSSAFFFVFLAYI